jgi:hypothetical protein
MWINLQNLGDDGLLLAVLLNLLPDPFLSGVLGLEQLLEHRDFVHHGLVPLERDSLKLLV